MSHRILTGLGLSLAGLLIATGCKPASMGPLTVPLQYRTPEGASSVQPMTKGEVAVVVTDQREKKDVIGQNIEEVTPKVVLTSDDPAAFVRGVVVRQLQTRGATIAAAGTPARRQVVVQLTNFYCTESNMYRSSVVFKAQVFGEDGKPMWDGLVSGTAETWGRSYKAEDYQETLSDATSDAVAHLLSTPGVVAALQ